MVRGNWQRRVELNESRRNEAKQKKLRSEEKKAYKSLVQKLLSVLERHDNVIWQHLEEKAWEIHIWVDSIPSDEVEPRINTWDEKSTKSSRSRDRSLSIESERPIKAKKKHPNSKRPMEEKQSEVFSAPRLCCSQFFSGECKNMNTKKKGYNSCMHTHYTKRSKTLAEVLKKNESGGSKAEKILALSEAALPEAQEEESMATEDSRAMDMVYDIVLPSQSGKGSISEYITGILSQKGCSIGSIVYLTFNGVLLFDRYRDGLVIPENDLRGCLSRGKRHGASFKNNSDMWKALPGSVLEYVLIFLSEREIATMSSVCQMWNAEIGKSPNLWRHFLQRRNWPFDSNGEEDTDVSLRSAFMSHYSAVRDMKAIQEGIAEIMTKTTSKRKESFSRSLESLREPPNTFTFCRSVEIWSPNHVLCAYESQCRLHLFTTIDKSGSDGEKVCRELVGKSVDPYRKTKRIDSELVDMAIDEENIACLLATSPSNGGQYSVRKMVLVKREDFLISDLSAEEGTLQVIDINESIINFLLEFDDVNDEDLEEFLSLLEAGYDLESFEVNPSQSIASCGNGLFMIHASLELEHEFYFYCQKNFLFSADTGTIVLMSDVNIRRPYVRAPPGDTHHEDMVLTSSVSKDDRGSYQCTFASASSRSLDLTTDGYIDSNAVIHNPSPPTDNSSVSVLAKALSEGYSLWTGRRQRAITLVGSYLVVADNTSISDFNEGTKYRSFVSFYSQEIGCKCIEVDGNFQVLLLVPIREEHVLVLGTTFTLDDNDFDGDWLGLTSTWSRSLQGYIFHVPSRTQISDICFLNDLERKLNHPGILYESPVRIAVNGGTVAAAMWREAIVMTGEDVRTAKENLPVKDNNNSKMKKKKKKTPKKGGKKDGFARGMSLRG